MSIKKSNTRLYLFITLIIFGIVYALISFFNHYLFRTYALDLGLYTNALYKYAHLQMADSAMFKNVDEYLLGDHFDLYLPLFSPLVYIFGTYTLLIVQIAAILSGAYGVHKYFRLTSPGNDLVQLAAPLCFLSFFGIFSAVSFDYHSNVIAAMIVPWFFYNFKKKNYLASSILVVAILISKENMALWMFFICMGLLIEYRKDRKSLIYLLAFSVFSMIYFTTVVNIIMPLITVSGKYNGFGYTSLGQTPVEALKDIILHPTESFNTLFNNHTNQPYGDYVKLELHIMVLVSGLYLLLFKPYYLIMLIPVYFQKMFHDNVQMWGVNGQYAIEFAPILAIGIFTGISEFKSRNIERVLALVALAGILFSTIRVMDRTVVYTNKSRIRFYQASHYKRNYNVKAVQQQLKQLPGDAKISALTPLVPHLALRDNIYQFPILKDAEYVVYSEKEGKYPLSEDEFAIEIKRLTDSGEWVEWSKSEGFVILKKLEVDF